MLSTHTPPTPVMRLQEFAQSVYDWFSTDAQARQRSAFLIVLVAILGGFELFNLASTDFALTDLLGGASFAGLRWATLLAVAFCAIDLAGLIRLFGFERGEKWSLESIYLTAAWLLGATANAVMTWWAVTLAMLDSTPGNAIVARATLLTWVPIAIAGFVWLTRLLVIGAFAMQGAELWQRLTSATRPRTAVRPTPSVQRQPIARQRRYRLPGEARPASLTTAGERSVQSPLFTEAVRRKQRTEAHTIGREQD